MSTSLIPYLQFSGNTREAMEFYHGIFGGELDVFTGEDYGLPAQGHDIVMHSQLTTEDGWSFMASDHEEPSGSGFGRPGRSMCLYSEAPEPKLEQWYEQLAAAGEAVLPLERVNGGSRHGVVVDRFGVRWMFDIPAE